MPLIMFCGLPSSGKTTRAQELIEFFEKNHPKEFEKIVHVSDDTVFPFDSAFSKPTAYSNSKNEKQARSQLKTIVIRNLTKKVLVVLDTTNYIKSQRYELFLEAKNASTSSCVVFCDTSAEEAIEWNKKKIEKGDQNCVANEIIQEMSQRFETPNQNTKWDKPLFVIKPTDQTPFSQIAEFIVNRKMDLAPNMATIPDKLGETNSLYEIDKKTNGVIEFITSIKATANPGDQIPIAESSIKFRIPIAMVSAKLSVPNLRKIRTQFISMSQMNPPPKDKIVEHFVKHLNNALSL